MRRILKKQDVLEMIYGACLMGGGGGGSLDNGVELLEAAAKEGEIAIEMITTDEIEKNLYTCFCGGFGSPIKFKERGAKSTVEMNYAFEGLVRQSYNMNRKIGYIMPVEYGALNTVLPFLVAMKAGYPVVDADGAGRAVPSLQTLLYGVNDVPLAPFVMADGARNITVAYPDNCLDAAWMDGMARHMCQASDMVMGVAGGIVTRQQIEEDLCPDGYTYAQKIGKAILNAKEKNLDYMEELKKVIECKEFFRGKITGFAANAERGWDFGTVDCDVDGKKYRIDYQNESIVIWEDDKVLMTAPDLICTINLDTGEPMSNADLEEGMNILALGIPAPKSWFKTDRYLTCWQSHFDAVQYTGAIVRY